MYCWVCYEQMTVLIWNENRARRIEDGMTLELYRSFPMVMILLDQVHRQKANLSLRDSPRSVPLPLWMLQYVGFPAHLVCVIHRCCRVGHTRGGFVYWSCLKDEAVDCLRTLVAGNSTTDRDASIWERVQEY